MSDGNPAVMVLARTLERCRGPEMVKFKSRFRVLASGRDGTQVTFLVLGRLVKVEGKAFTCSEDVQNLLERVLSSEVGESPEDERWRMPPGARIEHVRARVREGYETDPVAGSCGDFELSEPQLRELLLHARTITRRQLHDDFDWLPCVVTADVTWGSRKAVAEISATMVGTVVVKDGPDYVLACDPECATRVQQAAPASRHPR